MKIRPILSNMVLIARIAWHLPGCFSEVYVSSGLVDLNQSSGTSENRPFNASLAISLLSNQITKFGISIKTTKLS